MPFLQNAGQKVNFLFALVAVLYLVLLTVDFVRYGGGVAPSWITAAFAIALGGWIGCRRSEKPAAPRVFAVLAVVPAAARVFRPRIRAMYSHNPAVPGNGYFSTPFPANFSHWRSKNRAPDENSDARILFYARHSRRAAGSKSGMA